MERSSCRRAAETSAAKKGDHSKGFYSICWTKCFLTFAVTLLGSCSKHSNDLVSPSFPLWPGKHSSLVKEGLGRGACSLLLASSPGRACGRPSACVAPWECGLCDPSAPRPFPLTSILRRWLQCNCWECWRQRFFFFLVLRFEV